MTETTLLDTGPLVAFFRAAEEHHRWVVERFKELPPSFLTCESVLTEAFFLLNSESQALDKLNHFLEEDLIEIPFCFAEERPVVMELMRRYRNVPMSLADACLVRMSEIYPNAPILTLDGDFKIYRRNRRERINLIIPN